MKKDNYKVLTDEYAKLVGENGVPWYKVVQYVVSNSEPMSFFDKNNASICLASPLVIKKWVENNVIYSVSPKIKKAGYSSSLTYHGEKFTGRELAHITGYSINTIYSYWQRANKNDKVFSAMIDNKLPPEIRLRLTEKMNGSYTGYDSDFDIIEDEDGDLIL